MTVFIEGVGIAEYRSFGSEIQRIGPFRKINLFIGQNNSGKSNILRFLVNHYVTLVEFAKATRGRFKIGLSVEDRHIGSSSGRFRFALGIRPTTAQMRHFLGVHQNEMEAHHERWVTTLLCSDYLTHGTALTWIDYSSVWEAEPELDSNLVEALYKAKILESYEWQRLWTLLARRTGGDIKNHWIPETMRVLGSMVRESPPITMVPAIRQIDASDIKEHDFSGAGLVDRLARLQNPDANREESKDRFDEINRFVQSVTGSKDATLEIPYGRDRILVQMDGKTLPLAALGTGIHEVIILAAAATVLRNQVLCLDA